MKRSFLSLLLIWPCQIFSGQFKLGIDQEFSKNYWESWKVSAISKVPTDVPRSRLIHLKRFWGVYLQIYLLLNLSVISQQLILSSFDLNLNRYWLTVDSSMPILWSNTNDIFKITSVKAIVAILTISNSWKKTHFKNYFGKSYCGNFDNS